MCICSARIPVSHIDLLATHVTLVSANILSYYLLRVYTYLAHVCTYMYNNSDIRRS